MCARRVEAKGSSSDTDGTCTVSHSIKIASQAEQTVYLFFYNFRKVPVYSNNFENLKFSRKLSSHKTSGFVFNLRLLSHISFTFLTICTIPNGTLLIDLKVATPQRSDNKRLLFAFFKGYTINAPSFFFF